MDLDDTVSNCGRCKRRPAEANRRTCAVCRAKQDAYYAKNRERIAAYQKQWLSQNPELRKEIARVSARKSYAKNPEKHRKASAEFAKKNKDNVKAYNAEYRRKHKEYFKAKEEEWRLAHPGYKRAQYEKHREREKARSRNYAANNREKVRLQSKKSREKDPEKWREISRKSYRKNREKSMAATRRWKLAHPEQVKAAAKAWSEANKELLKASSRSARHKRRALLKTVENTLTKDEVLYAIEMSKGLCDYCRKAYEVPVVEHIVPLVKMGANALYNIAISCTHCNATKYTKDVQVFMPGWVRPWN